MGFRTLVRWNFYIEPIAWAMWRFAVMALYRNAFRIMPPCEGNPSVSGGLIIWLNSKFDVRPHKPSNTNIRVIDDFRPHDAQVISVMFVDKIEGGDGGGDPMITGGGFTKLQT